MHMLTHMNEHVHTLAHTHIFYVLGKQKAEKPNQKKTPGVSQSFLWGQYRSCQMNTMWGRTIVMFGVLRRTLWTSTCGPCSFHSQFHFAETYALPLPSAFPFLKHFPPPEKMKAAQPLNTESSSSLPKSGQIPNDTSQHQRRRCQKLSIFRGNLLGSHTGKTQR